MTLTKDEVANESAYFEWLLKTVHHERYRFLFKRLHSKAFYWTVPNDGNRIGDAEQLRDDFSMMYWTEVWRWSEKDISVLEVLIALSIRIEGMIAEDPRPGEWLYKMLSNLKLTPYDDNRFDERSLFEIDRIVETFLDREYDAFGNGGIFPLKCRTEKDQRDVELWYQLMAYLNEHYDENV